MGIVGESVQRRLEVGRQCEEVMNEAEETMKKLMAPRELMFTEALIPMCYHHWEGTWDVCDYVIWSVCWKRKKGSGVVLCERLLGIECRLIVGLNLLP